MKAWSVGTEDVGYVLCLAETRGRAKRFFPDIGYGYFDAQWIDLRVRRQPWLDGDGPEREVIGVWHDCIGPHDDGGRCLAGHDWCFEGEYLDKAATVQQATSAPGREISE
jgi:hypothetical protein